MTTVIHIHHNTHPSLKDVVYIGCRRYRCMHYGNPFTHLPADSTAATVHVDTRELAIQACEEWLRGDEKWKWVEPARRRWILANLEKLRNKRLACYCHPLPCHGDIYVKLLNEKQT